MRILVTKVGCVFKTRDYSSNPVGEQGETEGVIRHLIAQGHEVIYFGKSYGLEDLVSHVITPTGFKGTHLADTLTAEEQYAAGDLDYENLKAVGADECDAWIHVLGYSATSSLINNRSGATVQNASINYIGPVILAAKNLGIPIIAVNNDPRTYLKTQEFANQYPECLPIALLDQSEHVKVRTIGRTSVVQKATYARCESWGYLPQLENLATTPCTVIAHAHIKDGCKKAGRADAWEAVLGGNAFDELPGMRVYGNGWQHFPGYTPERFPGVVKGGDVGPLLACCLASPCVAADVGFYTGKPYVLNASGVIPLMFGDGTNPFTWDPDERLVPFDHPTRVVNPGDLARAVDYAEKHYDELHETFREKLVPDFTMLDNCLDDLPKLSTDPDWFWELYGGYRLSRGY